MSQKNLVVAEGGETLYDRDIIDYEWSMKYIEFNKKIVLLIAWNKEHGQLEKDRPISYGRLLHLDYEEPDSNNLILFLDGSKGVQKMYV